jgi:hypothetical protein
MNPKEVHDVLSNVGARYLHHANTVATSCTFLEHGALLSRAYVEEHNLVQTVQGSDTLDKRYGIWDAVFLDHVDIHLRGGRTKGPNQYGPVLFVFELNVLLSLPQNADVRVTRRNPVHWRDGQEDRDRWYQTAAELSQDISFGDFDKMLVIFHTNGRFELTTTACRVMLDNPNRRLRDGADAFEHAVTRLITAAEVGGVHATITNHQCREDCICQKKYAEYSEGHLESRFA